VTWQGAVPVSREALGRHPIVRRWEGGPRALVPAGGSVGDPIQLEGGIQVAFPPGGQARAGDYWLVPARTVRMAYGLSRSSGTIEWPPGGRGPLAQPPVGPDHHVAPIAILARVAGGDGAVAGWAVESDCRRLFDPLTALVSIDLVGGDGQEALPGSPLPQPVRVAVRRGGRGLPGVALALTAEGGTVAEAAAGRVRTGADGVAQLTWTLDPRGPAAQRLTVRRLDDHGRGVDVPVVVTGRLSRVELRLLGGDGQEVTARGLVVPNAIRVVVDSPSGPLAGVKVVAASQGGDPRFPGLVIGAREGETRLDTLTGTGAGDTVVVETGEDGVAAFWWQPGFPRRAGRSSVLEISVAESADAPIRVGAQLDVGGGTRPSGVHVTKVSFASGREFVNDSPVDVSDLISGIMVSLDGPVVQRSVQNKRVVRVELDLPWPLNGEDSQVWLTDGTPIGFRTTELAARTNADGPLIGWAPAELTGPWLKQMVVVLRRRELLEPVRGRFVIDGWAVISEAEPSLHLNGHARTVTDGDRTRLELPTDDEVTGGRFEQWFDLVIAAVREGVAAVEVPDVIRRTEGVAVRLLEEAGLTVEVVREPSDDVRAGQVVRTEPAAGAEVEVGSQVVVVRSGGRAG
jgi:hypothetical protein